MLLTRKQSDPQFDSDPKSCSCHQMRFLGSPFGWVKSSLQEEVASAVPTVEWAAGASARSMECTCLCSSRLTFLSRHVGGRSFAFGPRHGAELTFTSDALNFKFKVI